MMHIQHFYIRSVTKQLLIGFIIGIWLFLFFYVVEPFDMYQLQPEERTFAAIGYSIVAVIAYALVIPIQYAIYQVKQSWGIWQEILLLFSLLIIAGIISFLFFKFILLPNEPNTYDFWFFFSKRVVPTLLFMLPVMIFLRWFMGKKTTEITETTETTSAQTQKIMIKGESKSEVLQINASELVYITSANNYVEVYYLLNNELHNELFRNKISVLHKEFPFLLRTHRSYLINPIHFLEWKRDSARSVLILKPNQTEIPISKTYKNNIIEKIVDHTA